MNKCLEEKPLSKEDSLYTLRSNEIHDVLRISLYLKNFYKIKQSHIQEKFLSISLIFVEICVLTVLIKKIHMKKKW